MELDFLTLIVPVLSAGVWACIGYINSWAAGDKEVDWSKAGATFLVGIAIGLFGILQGTTLSPEFIAAQIVAYTGAVATLDKLIHAILNYKNTSAANQ